MKKTHIQTIFTKQMTKKGLALFRLMLKFGPNVETCIVALRLQNRYK